MQSTSQHQLSYFTLLLMISFASINAMLFTPALPEISEFFNISSGTAELTMTWFLIGYASGQLIYGPVANRYGRKPALYFGIGLQIVSSLICIASGFVHQFGLLILGRFMVALGSGVGLKMTFTLINETHDPMEASRKLSYVILAFAITPALGVAIGGLLTHYFGWMSCFAAGIVYGIILLFAVMRLPETHTNLHLDALRFNKLISNYGEQFRNMNLVAGAFLMGNATSFVYLFAAVAPFVAMDLFDMNASEYGFATLLPSLGLILGSLTSAQLTRYFPLMTIVRTGILIAIFGVMLMLFSSWQQMDVYAVLFIPMLIIYYGLSFLMANISSYVMGSIHDKSHSSAVMHFINMGVATVAVLIVGLFTVQENLLPAAFLILCGTMMLSFTYITKNRD